MLRAFPVLEGKQGNDTLTGAGGADTFVWRDSSANGGAEVITDFHSGAGTDQDVLRFGMSNDGLSTTLTLVIGTVATTPGLATFLFNTSTHVLSFDADGAGGNGKIDIVTLTGVSTLTADNLDLF